MLMDKRYLLSVILAPIFFWGVNARAQQDNDSSEKPVDFQRTIGEWRILGDRTLHSCILVGPNSYNHTDFNVAIVGNGAVFDFVLRNNSWKALTDDAISIEALFKNGSGKLEDYWKLSAVGTSEAKGGPRINWTMTNEAEDGRTFMANLAKASEIWFFNGNAPITKFKLTGSAVAVEALDDCRRMLQISPDYDPFAGH